MEHKNYQNSTSINTPTLLFSNIFNYNKPNYSSFYNYKNTSNNNNLNHQTNQQINENSNKIPLNMNSLYTNMILYNSIMNNNNKNSKYISSLLTDFNNELSLEASDKKQQSKTQNLEPLIEKMESIDSPRFKNSRFLKFIKDINSNKININEEKNIIEQNENLKNEDLNDDENEIENLLNKAKKYMEYSREDLAKNILEEQILSSYLILKEENKKLLIKAYLYLILCYLNENEDLISISYILDFLFLINDNKNNIFNDYKFLNEEKYLNKEFIQKINQRDFDITDKNEYNNYIDSKEKIKKEIENFLQKLVLQNKNNEYKNYIMLLHALILFLNHNLSEAEKIISELIQLNNTNYFYYNLLGVIFANQKKYNDAINYYKKAIELNEKYPKALINFGVILYNKGEYYESCKTLIAALKIYDDIPEAWNYLMSNVIEMEKEDFIYFINEKNLEYIEQNLISKEK